MSGREAYSNSAGSVKSSFSQFTLESRDVIECVKKVNDEWGYHFFTLELLLPKVKSPCAAKFMCHAGDVDFWINVRQKYELLGVRAYP